MKTQDAHLSVFDTTIKLFFLILIVAWCMMIMYPFANIILWSLILTMALYPLHNSMSKKMGGRPKLASFILVFSILLIIILPIVLMIASLIDEVKQLKVLYDNGNLTIPPPTEKVREWPIIGEKLFVFWQSASENLEQLVLKYKDQLFEAGSKLGKGILSAFGGMIQILVALFIAGILLIVEGAGETMRKFIRKLAGNQGDDFADMTLRTVGSVVKGIIGVALILALLNGVVFLLAGIPYAGIWTLLVFVLGILQIPLFIITLPVIAYMFAVKEPVPAAVWTVLLLIAGLSDNVLKPILLGKGAPVPMLVIFIGVIGGFLFSGFIGLFTGAIVLSVGYKLFVTWVNKEELKKA